MFKKIFYGSDWELRTAAENGTPRWNRDGTMPSMGFLIPNI